MALTLRIVANIYGIDDHAVERAGSVINGRKNYFSNTGNLFYAAPNGTSFNGVTCNSVIELLPTGLVVNSKKYYAVETPAELVTNGI